MRATPDRTVTRALLVGLLLTALVGAFTPSAGAERAASQTRSYQAGLLDAGSVHACAIVRTGGLTCWGEDAYGQVGDGADGNGDQLSPTPVALPGGRRAVAVAAGIHHTCAIADDGSVACWGRDNRGQVGDGADGNADEPSPVPVPLPGSRRTIAVSAGGETTCAIDADGGLWCWGSDSYGMLGDGLPLVDAPAPVAVALPGDRAAVAVAVGDTHACAIASDGALLCWGRDASGEVGDGADGNADEPSPVVIALPGNRRAVAATAGYLHTCALLDDGLVACWGNDDDGQVGDGAPVTGQVSPTPIALPAGRTAVALAAGTYHTCAVTDDGALACWGNDAAGAIGDGVDGGANEPAPVAVSLPGGRRAVAVSSGEYFTCALADDGALACWGFDLHGQVGDGADGNANEQTASSAPLPLPTGSLAGRAADLSVSIEGAPASLALATQGSATVRLTNAGPDAATGLRVLLQPTLLTLAPTLIGQGAVAGGSGRSSQPRPRRLRRPLPLAHPARTRPGIAHRPAPRQAEADPDSTPTQRRPGRGRPGRRRDKRIPAPRRRPPRAGSPPID
ncbi:MAG: hypothetical protein R3C15_13660 [Thermoleophilia bacterium]